MRAFVETFPAAPLPAALSIGRLEMLVRAARHHGHTFRLSRVQDGDYRYFISDGCLPAKHVVMATNDIADVAAYFGVEGFASDVHELGPNARLGVWVKSAAGDAVPLAQERPRPLPVFAQASQPLALPRDMRGSLVPHSEEMKCRAEAIRTLAGYTMFDCRRALLSTDGDADQALALLVSTDGFARSKI